MTRPRIVIYGCGQYGGHIARFAAAKQWPIVAAFNRAGKKVGQDLGRLVGLDRDLGVNVQDCETADYESLKGKADIAIIAMTDRLSVNLPAYTRMMQAGLNVLCHGSEAYFPYGSDSETAATIDALAKACGVTFTGGGIWDTSRIWSGILIAGPSIELRSLRHATLTDAAGFGKATLLVSGAGMSVDEYDEKIIKAPSRISGLYKTIPHHVLHALGYTVTSCTERREPLFFDEPYYCALLERELAPGTVVGTRIVAEVETREGVSADTHIDLRCFREGDVEHMGWSVNGLPRSRIRIERDDSAYATAANLFNRIPDVIAAKAGIVVVSQMGPLRHSALA